MALIKVTCFSCHKVEELDRVGFRAECESCGADLHACLNCKFYDEGSYNECKEPVADRIKVKDRSNLCEFFQVGSGLNTAKTDKDDLLKAAEALFKKD